MIHKYKYVNVVLIVQVTGIAISNHICIGFSSASLYVWVFVFFGVPLCVHAHNPSPPLPPIPPAPVACQHTTCDSLLSNAQTLPDINPPPPGFPILLLVCFGCVCVRARTPACGLLFHLLQLLPPLRVFVAIVSGSRPIHRYRPNAPAHREW